MKKFLAITAILLLPFLGLTQSKFDSYTAVTASSGYYDAQTEKYVWVSTNTSLNIPVIFSYELQKIFIKAKQETTYIIYATKEISNDSDGIITSLTCVNDRGETVTLFDMQPVTTANAHILVILYADNLAVMYVLNSL